MVILQWDYQLLRMLLMVVYVSPLLCFSGSISKPFFSPLRKQNPLFPVLPRRVEDALAKSLERFDREEISTPRLYNPK